MALSCATVLWHPHRMQEPMHEHLHVHEDGSLYRRTCHDLAGYGDGTRWRGCRPRPNPVRTDLK